MDVDNVHGFQIEVLQLRDSILASRDFDGVLRKINSDECTQIFTDALCGNEVDLNLVKYIARCEHLGSCVGLKSAMCQFLAPSQFPPKTPPNIQPTAELTLKATIILRYCFQHSPLFLSIHDLVLILFDAFPLQSLSEDGHQKLKREAVANVLRAIAYALISTIQQPWRVEEDDKEKLLKLKDYLQYIPSKSREEVRERLAKHSTFTGLSSLKNVPERMAVNHQLQRGTQLIVSAVRKRAIFTSTTVVRTTTKETLLEEVASERALLSQLEDALLRRHRKRVIAAQQERLPVLGSPGTGSVRKCYHTQARFIKLLLAKARRREPISIVDIQSVKAIFIELTTTGWVLRSAKLVNMVTEIFHRLSCYQRLDDILVEDLLEITLNPKFRHLQIVRDAIKRSRGGPGVNKFILIPHQFLGDIRLAKVAKNVESSTSHTWRWDETTYCILVVVSCHSLSAEGITGKMFDELNTYLKCAHLKSPDVKRLVALLMWSGYTCDERWRDALVTAVDMLKDPVIAEQAVDFILRLLQVEGRAEEVDQMLSEGSEKICLLLFKTVLNYIKFYSSKTVEKCVKVVETLVSFGWSFKYLLPEDIYTMIRLAEGFTASRRLRETVADCILLAMEKFSRDPGYVSLFSSEKLKKHFEFLMTATSSKDMLQQRLRLLTLVTLYKERKVFKGKYFSRLGELILEEFQSQSDFPSQIFIVLTEILRRAKVDTDDSNDSVVKAALQTVLKYCSSEGAATLPQEIVDAVQELFLTSKFLEECSEILDKVIEVGRKLSDQILERFAKHLRTPNLTSALLWIKRLWLAGDNQELPEDVFQRLKLEIIGLRLLPSADTNKQMDHGDVGKLVDKLKHATLNGTLMSPLQLESVSFHFRQNDSTKLRETVVEFLSSTAANSQSLPQSVIDLCLKVGPLGLTQEQLILASTVVIRRQQIPNQFWTYVRDNLDALFKLPHCVWLVETMILYNQSLPPEVATRYVETVKKGVESYSYVPTQQMVSSLVKLVETRAVAGESLDECTELLEKVSKSGNVSLTLTLKEHLEELPEEAVVQGVNTQFQKLKENAGLDFQASLFHTLLTFSNKLVDEIKYIGQLPTPPPMWEARWAHLRKAELTRGLAMNMATVAAMRSLLEAREGQLSPVEVMVVESLCFAMETTESPEIREEIEDIIVSSVMAARRIKLSRSAWLHFSRAQEMGNEHDILSPLEGGHSFEELAKMIGDKLGGKEDAEIFSLEVALYEELVSENRLSEWLEGVVRRVGDLLLSEESKFPENLITFMGIVKVLKTATKESEQAKVIIDSYLQKLIEEQTCLPVRKILDFVQARLLMSSFGELSLSEGEEVVVKLESHLGALLAQDYNYASLLHLIQNWKTNLPQAMTSVKFYLEEFANVLFTLLKYGVSAEHTFPQIMGGICQSKWITEWPKICNKIVMDSLYTGSSGVKTVTKIAHSFKIANDLEKNSPGWLESFKTDADSIRGGNFDSGIAPKGKDIGEWLSTDISEWAEIVKWWWWPRGIVKELVAVISRACVLTQNYNLSPIQILALYDILHNSGGRGRFLQVATGSGKSTIIMAVAVAKCLMGLPVDVYTSSPVLAERDAVTWASVYEMFGLSVGHNGDQEGSYSKGPKVCYQKDVVYGDISEFQFDVLRHEYSGLETRARSATKIQKAKRLWKRGSLPQRKYGFAIVDEVDSILVDDITKVASLSSIIPGLDLLSIVYHLIWEQLHHLQECLGDGNKPLGMTIDDFVTNELKKYTSKLLKNLNFPQRIKSFATSQVDNWVESAITALAFQENVEYVIDAGEVKPVDYASTGIIQSSTRWNNGLHQFLQLKHSLAMTSESVTTNFLSNAAMISRYGSNLVGVTGTLGFHPKKKGSVENEGTSVEEGGGVPGFLQRVYDVDTIIIPDFHYDRFKKIGRKVISSRSEWVKELCSNVMHEKDKQRAVLIICESILDAEEVTAGLQARLGALSDVRLKLYSKNTSGNQKKHVSRVENYDMVVATNLAGRGTDISTSSIEVHGGLHVILSFLPDSLRVEQQAFGRTSRQGNKGSGELIVQSEVESFEELQAARDKAEQEKLKGLEEKLKVIRRRDGLFSKFCELYSPLHTTKGLSDIHLKAMEERWAFLLKKVDDAVAKGKDVELVFTEGEFEVERLFKGDMGLVLPGSELGDYMIATSGNCFYWIQLGNERYISKGGNKDAITNFNKAVDCDDKFAAGGYAGLGFSTLKGKGKDNPINECSGGYKELSLDYLKKAIGMVCSEVVSLNLIQTLLSQRDPTSTSSDLYKQLTEKTRVTSEYAEHLQRIVTNVEKSLRKVVRTKVQRENADLVFNIAFHGLTCHDDVGLRDQAVDILDKSPNIAGARVALQDQDLGKVVDAIGETPCELHLDGVPFQNLESLINELKVASFKIIITADQKPFLEALLNNNCSFSCVSLIRETKSTSNLIERTELLKTSLEQSDVTQFLAEDTDILFVVVEIKRDQIEVLKNSIPTEEEDMKMSIILTTVSSEAIRGQWQNKQNGAPGLLQMFQTNKLIFPVSSDPKKCISSLREANFDFVLLFEGLSSEDAANILNISRPQEDVVELAIKQMGDQFSSLYKPQEIIKEFQGRGYCLMPQFGESLFLPWRTMVAISALAAAQMGVGALLSASGVGIAPGMNLGAEGMKDIRMLKEIYSKRYFSWKDYALRKAVGVAYGALTFGISEFVMGPVEVVEKTVEQQIFAAMFDKAAKIVIKEGMDYLTKRALKMSKGKIREKVEEEVKLDQRFVKRLKEIAAEGKGDEVVVKIQEWLKEVLSSLSDNDFNRSWAPIAEALLGGIFHSPAYIGCTLSVTATLASVISGCNEIVKVTQKVTQYLHAKVSEHFSPATALPSVESSILETSELEASEIVRYISEEVANHIIFVTEAQLVAPVVRNSTEALSTTAQRLYFGPSEPIAGSSGVVKALESKKSVVAWAKAEFLREENKAQKTREVAMLTYYGTVDALGNRFASVLTANR